MHTAPYCLRIYRAQDFTRALRKKRCEQLLFVPSTIQYQCRLHNSSWLGSRNVSAEFRKRIGQSDRFEPWLSNHLSRLVQQVSDPAYITFLNTFRQTLATHRLRRKFRSRPPRPASWDVWRPKDLQQPESLLQAINDAFIDLGESAVNAQLRYSFNGAASKAALARIDPSARGRITDLRYPIEWYPATRAIQRHIHLHVGPTNSGKTFQALQRLESADRGVYAGPLRLLAYEVYSRFNAKGRACDLITGDEQIMKGAADEQRETMKSCTVEMVPLQKDYDVAVIDEIQMIGHPQRGWAWTQALLGIKAQELHLCGEERTVPLLKELVASMGDKLEIHTYERLSPLAVMPTSLRGSLSNLRKGDCIVSFSRVGIHAMKRDIEKATQKRVAIIYGSLPPEIRAQQARNFNDPNSDYDFLVASDAIGMGLNLAIKRIIFESVYKFNGISLEVVPANEIKQIAGRAGRYRIAGEDEITKQATNDKSLSRPGPAHGGLATTLEEADLPILRSAMNGEALPVATAGLYPPAQYVMDFAAYFPPSTSLSYILQRLHEIALTGPSYSLCQLTDQVPIADVIQCVNNLSIEERLIFCASPASCRQKGMDVIVVAFAKCVGEHKRGNLLDIPELAVEILDEQPNIERTYLDGLERLHKALILYTWLSYRFVGVFMDREMAFHVKELVEQRIDTVLTQYSASPEIRDRLRRARIKIAQAASISKDEQRAIASDAALSIAL